MTTFIKMEKAVAKKRREDEHRNQKIREYKAIEQAGLKEEGSGVRESFKQPTYLSNEYRS